MKLFALLALCACAAAVVPIAQPGSRLIQFNENEAPVWMTPDEVDALADECGQPDQAGPGKHGHGGFMDVTDHADLAPIGLVAPAPPALLTRQEELTKRFTGISSDYIAATITHLSSYNNRYYTAATGQQAAVWLQGQFAEYIRASGRTDASVELFPHTWVQSSVIARIQGETDELVIIGGHEDSINSKSAAAGRAPGADDDASGTSVVLEAFRVLVSDPSFKPRRTVEFHTYSAEEVGLRGSQAIAEAYLKEKKIVAGQLQMDMTAYAAAAGYSPAIVQDYVDLPLTAFVTKLAGEYTNLKWTTTSCGYGCSDHASWNKAGYPSAFPFETIFSGSNAAIHTDADVIAKLDIEQAKQFAQLAIAFAVELSA